MCDVPRSRLIAWIDGELDDVEALAVKAHVSRCRQCRVETARIRALTSEIGEYCDFVGLPRRRRPWIWVAACAAAVLLAAGLLWTRPHRTAPVIAKAATVAVEPVAPVARPAAVAATHATGPHRVRRPPPREVQDEAPGVLVAVSLYELLPVGAAPPGAVLVGNLTFDAGGLPSGFQPR